MKTLRYSLLILLFFSARCAAAQRIFHVSPKGEIRTISAAAKLARSGDIITVHAGIYREWVQPHASGVTYQAAKGEHPEIKGSEVIKTWTKQADGKWQVILDSTFFGDYNPYTDLIRGDWYFPQKKLHTGEVFLNGKALEEYITWTTETQSGKTLITADFGSADPNRQTAEISVRPACFYPKHNHIDRITVRGFRMSQAATQWAAPTAEQPGLLGTNWSKGWIIENNIISDSKCAGITLGKDRASGQNPWTADRSKDGADLYNDIIKLVAARDWNKQSIGSHIVRNNTVYNCGAAGICGSLGAVYSQITGNLIYDIYTKRNFWGAEMAGIKIHGAVDMLIKDNEVHNTFLGLWLDWMAQGTRISGNLFYDNSYDLFTEVNHGPYLADNNVMLSPVSLKDWSEGGAFVFNIFGGKLIRAPQDRRTPYFKPHDTRPLGITEIKGGDNRFVSNLFAGKGVDTLPPKMHPWEQPDSLWSWGPALYKGAAQPVSDQDNEVTSQPLTYRISAGGFRLLTVRKTKSRTLSTASLGKTILARQGYTEANGRPILIHLKNWH